MVRIFFSYSHKDEALRDELEVHLTALRRQGLVEFWHDRRIGAGEEFDPEIDEAIRTAHVVLLLVSPDFIASDYCYGREMTVALERHDRSEARVIPVILRPCLWQGLPFGRLMATPRDGRPVTKFPTLDDGFLEVTQAIRDAAEQFADIAKPAARARDSITAYQGPTPAVLRSGNLRVKRNFSDHERDEFLAETLDYLANFFEGSLRELEQRHGNLRATYRRLDQNHFYAALYDAGQRVSDCTIWRSTRGGGFVNGIAYTNGEDTGDNRYNECLSIVDDGYALLLRPMMGALRWGHDRDISPLRAPLNTTGAC